MKKTLLQKLGLLGIASFLSYTAAVVFAPLAYPGYHWMAQAVSDLSAANAPSLALWNQLSALYNTCEVLCATIVCIGIQGKKTKLLRAGIYLFAIMEWISAVGYRMFPLSDSGYAGAFQDVMHMAITAAVVLLSIVSLALWNQLSAFYNTCEVVCVTLVCIGLQGRKTKLLRTGVSLFAVMEWVSAIGYRMFPLSESGYAGAFQDVMHMAVTAAVVLLSIVSLSIIIAAGAKDRSCRSYGVCAAVALGMMLVGALGMKIVPAAYFGVVERFSVFAATGFNAALGIHLFAEKEKTNEK